MKALLLAALDERVLVGDGAMGTQLQMAGLAPGECGERWNLDEPEKVAAIQRAYAEAGSDCLITNTFGGCRLMLERHGLGERVAEINRAAVEIARAAFGERGGFVLGDIGPFGGMMEPYGETPECDVADALREQAEALVTAGVDAIIVETQAAFEEMDLGIAAARSAGAPCIIASMAYDVNAHTGEARTMMGIDAEMAAEHMVAGGVDVVALNCGRGIDVAQATKVVRRYRAQCDRPLMAQPNAGQPRIIDGRAIYDQSAEAMANEYPQLIEAGARIVGACCGSTPEHIRLIRRIVDAHNAEAGKS